MAGAVEPRFQSKISLGGGVDRRGDADDRVALARKASAHARRVAQATQPGRRRTVRDAETIVSATGR